MHVETHILKSIYDWRVSPKEYNDKTEWIICLDRSDTSLFVSLRVTYQHYDKIKLLKRENRPPFVYYITQQMPISMNWTDIYLHKLNSDQTANDCKYCS